MTFNLIIWALLTGVVTAWVWLAVVVLNKRRELADHHAELSDELQQRLDDLAAVTRRLAEVEERLDFAERVIGQREVERLPLPKAP